MKCIKMHILLFLLLTSSSLLFPAAQDSNKSIKIEQIKEFSCKKNLIETLGILYSKNNRKNLFPFFTLDQLEELLATTMESPFKKLFVAYKQNTVVGLVIVSHNKKALNLDTLAVKESMQNQEIGSALLTTIISNLPPQQKISVIVDSNAKPAKKLYKNFGFIYQTSHGPYEEHVLTK